MYDDMAHLKEKKAYQSIINGTTGSAVSKKSFLYNLKPYSHYSSYENKLISCQKITFNQLFHEPLGCYMIKSFMASNFSLCNAIFISDVELYKKLRAPSGREKVATLIFEKFINPEKDQNTEESVFSRFKNFYNKFEAESKTVLSSQGKIPKILGTGDSNCVGYYNKAEINRILDKIESRQCDQNLLDIVYNQIYNDMRFDIFPRFLKSDYYKRYICLKSVETEEVSLKDFSIQATLGHGAYGFVTAALKKNTGKLYAIKCLSKKHIIASQHTKSVLDEKTNLARMDSHFVTCLKYSFMDKSFVYLCMDLMKAGDLKKLLIKQRTFTEEQSRFYAAEIILGLQHIHEKGIIYRDMKLENILLDEKGHIKISDLGLSVCKKKIKGYAGTPGYTAPEVINGEYYDKRSDFFSLGVIIYRFLAGRKPFLDRLEGVNKNTLVMEPKYPKKYFSPEATDFIKKLLMKNPKDRLGSGNNGIDDIKNHEWFAPIDFGLLEAGYLDPPYIPDEPVDNSRMTVDQKIRGKRYKKIKVTAEFNMQFENFNHVSKSAVQSEVVEVLQSLDKVEASDIAAKANPRVAKAQCCAVL